MPQNINDVSKSDTASSYYGKDNEEDFKLTLSKESKSTDTAKNTEDNLQCTNDATKVQINDCTIPLHRETYDYLCISFFVASCNYSRRTGNSKCS